MAIIDSQTGLWVSYTARERRLVSYAGGMAMKIGTIPVALVVALILSSCSGGPYQEASRPSPAAPGSPLRELMQAVRQAEADTHGGDLPQMKAAVAAAAMRIFRTRGIKELTED